MTAPRYRAIVDHYEACLEEHGDTHLGVDWPNAEDAETRHGVMLELVRDRPATLLDFGCGASHFYEHIVREGVTGIDYAGLDLSARFVELSRQKHPGNRYWCADILDEDVELPRFDYVVMNGVFTEKLDLPFDEMFAFVRRVVERVWEHTDRGLAFNVMNKHVDWERDDLFHLPFDDLAAWLVGSVSRNIVMRADYGLYEYTTYVYR
ncbi:class I SAM-dependent methyltransferase [Svornostia abyssi]|uniref:Class I SAM-dependent methyltransferase n=1 Tax=Svornostia abyssi TaxID=2898438 RepID=A0ABY5PHF5_9ACTN|nr:class I SAM-dependent methyltransferase [Parviterribacteraceae bacterium J379]